MTDVNSDTDLAAWWQIQSDANEGRQLMRLVAIAAQWERVLELWQRLADRCKTEQRPATANENAILSGAVQIYNLIWRDKQATLQSATSGGAFDYQQHERGTLTGAIIRAEWLPGLRSPAGELQKKPLVAT